MERIELQIAADAELLWQTCFELLSEPGPLSRAEVDGMLAKLVRETYEARVYGRTQ